MAAPEVIAVPGEFVPGTGVRTIIDAFKDINKFRREVQAAEGGGVYQFVPQPYGLYLGLKSGNGVTLPWDIVETLRDYLFENVAP